MGEDLCRVRVGESHPFLAVKKKIFPGQYRSRVRISLLIKESVGPILIVISSTWRSLGPLLGGHIRWGIEIFSFLLSFLSLL